MLSPKQKELEYSQYLNRCLINKKKIDRWLERTFLFAAAVNVVSFVIYFFVLFLSIGLIGWTYARELWYQIPVMLGVLGICYKRNKAFCIPTILLVIFASLNPFDSAVPFGEVFRLLNLFGIIFYVICFIMLIKDEHLRGCPEYPDFSYRANTDQHAALSNQISKAKEELVNAETVYSTAPVQNYMDDLIVPSEKEEHI